MYAVIIAAALQAALGGKGELSDVGAVSMTEEARKGRLQPVIGRDSEVQLCLEILCRSSKNNPVIIGEPGVGKTAIAEGIAQLLAAGKVPAQLQGYELWSLDVSAMMSNTAYRGQMEERMKGLLAAVEDCGKVIMFIDEIHQLIGAGKCEGGMDVAQILKPALARGKFPCIGATTLQEYSQYIEKDAAMERRFQKVMVDPPSVEDAITIMQGLAPRLERHHSVSISPAAITAAVKLSDRYVTDRFLPDKAIDLLDTAAARKSMGTKDAAGEYSAGTAKQPKKKTAGGFAKKMTRTIIKQVPNPMLRSTLTGLSDKVTARVASVKGAVSGVMKAAPGPPPGGYPHLVTEEDIAQILAEWTGIPVQKVGGSEMAGLLELPDKLGERVKGQPEAVRAVAEAVQRARAGLADPNRPLASFLFLGSTGVGKTELAKALAASVFDSEDAMVRLDMGEFAEKLTVSRLLGAAPGYIGYDEGGQLTDPVRRKPYSIVLLDEVEKAHPDITNILLGVLDDGRLTDSKGNVVSFKNTIVIMTSNLGATHILAAAQAATAEEQQQLRQAAFAQVQQHFRPELLNRIDEQVVFRPLGMEQLRDIVRIQVRRVAARLADRRMRLELREGAVDWLADKGFDPANGARPVKRAIQRELENPLTQGLLRGAFHDGDIVVVDAKPGAPCLDLLHGGTCPPAAPAAAAPTAPAAAAAPIAPAAAYYQHQPPMASMPATPSGPSQAHMTGIAAAAAAVAAVSLPSFQHTAAHPGAPPPYQYAQPHHPGPQHGHLHSYPSSNSQAQYQPHPHAHQHHYHPGGPPQAQPPSSLPHAYSSGAPTQQAPPYTAAHPASAMYYQGHTGVGPARPPGY